MKASLVFVPHLHSNLMQAANNRNIIFITTCQISNNTLNRASVCRFSYISTATAEIKILERRLDFFFSDDELFIQPK